MRELWLEEKNYTCIRAYGLVPQLLARDRSLDCLVTLLRCRNGSPEPVLALRVIPFIDQLFLDSIRDSVDGEYVYSLCLAYHKFNAKKKWIALRCAEAGRWDLLYWLCGSGFVVIRPYMIDSKWHPKVLQIIDRCREMSAPSSFAAGELVGASTTSAQLSAFHASS